MNEVCLVTTYERPDFLWHCLDRLSHCPEIADRTVSVRLCLDRRLGRDVSAETISVMADFIERMELRWIERNPHSYVGNSYNTLESYKEALGTGAGKIYLVEDDVMVAPDFFRWHRAAHELENVFCSIAHPIVGRVLYDTFTDADKVYRSQSDFSSLGVCWKPEVLRTIVQHGCPQYFQDMVGYVRVVFPESKFGLSWTEQDGLIRRELVRSHLMTVYPCLPRAVHVGFYGYHRPAVNYRALPLKERIERVGQIISDVKQLSEHDVLKLGDLHVPVEQAYTWNPPLKTKEVFV